MSETISCSGAFLRLHCQHQALFEKEYKRSNRNRGTKILRCFPHCCPHHVDRSYCGSPLHVAVELDHPEAARNQDLFVFARFETLDAPRGLYVGQYYTLDSLLSGSQTEENPEAPWIEGVQQTVASTPAGAVITNLSRANSANASNSSTRLFALNGQAYAKWFYNWESGANKTQRLTKHVLKAYVFHRVSSSGAKPDDDGDGMSRAPDLVQVVEIVQSPAFTVVSYRRSGNETAPLEGMIPHYSNPLGANNPELQEIVREQISRAFQEYQSTPASILSDTGLRSHRLQEEKDASSPESANDGTYASTPTALARPDLLTGTTTGDRAARSRPEVAAESSAETVRSGLPRANTQMVVEGGDRSTTQDTIEREDDTMGDEQEGLGEGDASLMGEAHHRLRFAELSVTNRHPFGPDDNGGHTPQDRHPSPRARPGLRQNRFSPYDYPMQTTARPVDTRIESGPRATEGGGGALARERGRTHLYSYYPASSGHPRARSPYRRRPSIQRKMEDEYCCPCVLSDDQSPSAERGVSGTPAVDARKSASMKEQFSWEFQNRGTGEQLKDLAVVHFFLSNVSLQHIVEDAVMRSALERALAEHWDGSSVETGNEEDPVATSSKSGPMDRSGGRGTTQSSTAPKAREDLSVLLRFLPHPQSHRLASPSHRRSAGLAAGTAQSAPVTLASNNSTSTDEPMGDEALGATDVQRLLRPLLEVAIWSMTQQNLALAREFLHLHTPSLLEKQQLRRSFGHWVSMWSERLQTALGDMMTRAEGGGMVNRPQHGAAFTSSTERTEAAGDRNNQETEGGGEAAARESKEEQSANRSSSFAFADAKKQASTRWLSDAVLMLVFKYDRFASLRSPLRSVLSDPSVGAWESFVAQMRENYMVQQLGGDASSDESSPSSDERMGRTFISPFDGEWILQEDGSRGNDSNNDGASGGAGVGGSGMSLWSSLLALSQLRRVRLNVTAERTLRVRSEQSLLPERKEGWMEVICDGRPRITRVFPNGLSSLVGGGCQNIGGDYMCYHDTATERLVLELYWWKKSSERTVLPPLLSSSTSFGLTHEGWKAVVKMAAAADGRRMLVETELQYGTSDSASLHGKGLDEDLTLWRPKDRIESVSKWETWRRVNCCYRRIVS